MTTTTSPRRLNTIILKAHRRRFGPGRHQHNIIMSGILGRYQNLILAVLVLGLLGAVSGEQVLNSSLRGSRPDTTARSILDNGNGSEHSPPRERKGDIFVSPRLSNDFDDDVIALYQASNDELSPEYLVSSPSTAPADFVSGASTHSGSFDLAPSPPAEANDSSLEQLNSTATTYPMSTPSFPPSASPSVPPPPPPPPPKLPSSAPTASAPPSATLNDIDVAVPRYHQEEWNISSTAADSSVDQLQSSHLLGDDKNKTKTHLIPALLTGFASTVLFCALFLVCANQRERYVQRKRHREQTRRAALTDDDSSAMSIDRAYSDPFDVYGEEEDRRSARSSNFADGSSSGSGGSYWVHSAMKELAEKSKRGKNHQTTQSSSLSTPPPNILPPLEDHDRVDDASIGLYSYVSSLTHSMMTMGSGRLAGDEIALNIDPSKARVASGNASYRDQRPTPSDEGSLGPSGSNEETSASVCSSLTDGTSMTLKSNDVDDTSMPAIGETEEEGHRDEDDRRLSIFSSSRRDVGKAKDVSTDSTHTPSTVQDDSLSLDLASEMERLHTLITSIKPDDEDAIYTDVDAIPKSLSEESFDFGVAEGREEI